MNSRRRAAFEEDMLAALEDCIAPAEVHAWQPAKRQQTEHQRASTLTRISGAPFGIQREKLALALKEVGDINWLHLERSGEGLVEWATLHGASMAVGKSGFRSLWISGHELTFTFQRELETRMEAAERIFNRRNMEIYRMKARKEAVRRERLETRAARRVVIKAALSKLGV